MSDFNYAFFSKVDPRITTWLGGRGVKFVDIGNNTGLYSTSDPGETQELRTLIQRGVGAIKELSYQEYLELKKNRSSASRRWREEVDNKELQRKAAARSQTDPGKNVPPAVSSEPAPSVVPMPEPGARPRPRAAASVPPPPPPSK